MSKNKHFKYSERYFVNELVAYLRSFGAYVYIDQDSGHERTKSGWDFLYGVNKTAIFVEAKMENNQLTDYQKYTKDMIVLSGGKYIELHLYKDNNKTIIHRSKIIISIRINGRILDKVQNVKSGVENLQVVAKILLLQLGIKIK